MTDLILLATVFAKLWYKIAQLHSNNALKRNKKS